MGMEELLGKMHGLTIRDSAYAILHGQLCCHWPNVTNDYPKPELTLPPPPLAAYTYQALPPSTIPNFQQQWLQTPAPTTAPTNYETPDGFFCSWPCTDGCTFCNQRGHCIRECSIAKDYVCSGCTTICSGQIHLPNGDPIPNDGSGHRVKAAIDAWLAARGPTPSAPLMLAPPSVRDIPPHAMLTTTTKHFEKIADTYALQVTRVSSPKPLS
jgi:hypothetical protein